jgi:serine/threonine protein kinase/predicted Zn-dependent protease
MADDRPPPETQKPTESDIGQAGGPGESTERKRLGDFELLRELGRGGMGVVYEARQISLNRRVALKVLPPGLGLTGQAVQRFEREAHAAAKLHHTNIVPVYATGKDDGCHYYAMELIEGQPLSDVLRDLSGTGSNPLLDRTVTQFSEGEEDRAESKPDTSQATSAITSLTDSQSGGRKWFDAVAKLIAEVADALEYAHGRGVIHRDIKPANLMLSSDGKLCVTDFGLARVAQEPGMTVSGSLMGTPAYMSPEQIAVGRVKLDHRTDIYSLGAVLYEMLSHRRPFPGESREEVLSGILTKDPRPPRRFNPRIPLDLETICLKAMEKDPDKRYATAGEFANDLRQYLQHGLIAARRAGIAKRTWKSIRRHPVIATVTVGAIIVAALAIFAGKSWTGMRQADIGRLISDARHQVTRGEYREAMAAVEKILASDPENLDARLIRARVHLHQRHYVDSVEAAREVLQHEPDHWEAHALIAGAAGWGDLHSVPVEEHRRVAEERAPDTADADYLRGLLAEKTWGQERDRGDSQEAIRWLTKALDKDPGHALALEVRSDAYVSLKDFPSALADAERLIAARSRSVEGYAQRGYVLRAMHDLDGALQAANRVIEIDPEAPIGYLRKGIVGSERGNRAEYIANLSKAIELDPRFHWVLEKRGINLRDVGRYDDAVVDLRRCIEINPDYARCYQALFWAHWWAGRREDALGVLEELENRAEQWVSVEGRAYPPIMRMEYYREIGEFERAEAETNRLIELLPHKIHGYASRMDMRRLMHGEAGVEEDCDLLATLDLDLPHDLLKRANLMRDRCHREEAALEDYEAVMKMAPSWADPLVDRAYLHRIEKRYEDALADLDRAIELAPSWLNAYYNRGLTFAAMEQFEDALADYEHCVELGSNAENLRANQSAALVRLGRDEDALQAIQAYIDENPKDVSAWRTRAVRLFDMGRLKEAIAALDHALEVNPGSEVDKMFRAFYVAYDPDACGESTATLDEYVSREAGNPDAWSSFAFIHFGGFRYTCPEYYDPDRALEFAEKAARFDSKSYAYQMNYGRALYHHGRYEEAIEVLEHVAGFVAETNSDLLFHLSMTHAQLGHTTEARSYYDRAIARDEEDRNRRPDTRFFRQEAAELLGVEP